MTHQIPRRVEIRRVEKALEIARPAAGVESRRPLSGDGRARDQARPYRGETECIEFEKAYKGRLADIAAKRRRRPHARRACALRGDRGRARPAHFYAVCSSRQHHRSAIAKFYGDMQERIPQPRCTAVLHTRPEPARRCGARQGHGDPAPRHYRPWVETSARTSRTSSKTASSSYSTRSR